MLISRDWKFGALMTMASSGAWAWVLALVLVAMVVFRDELPLA
jgi:hypothetical protein